MISSRYDYIVQLMKTTCHSAEVAKEWQSYVYTTLKKGIDSAEFEVEIIGSIDIADMFSKPITDIMVSSEKADMEDIVRILQTDNPCFMEIQLYNKSEERKMLRIYDDSNQPNLHVHVVSWDYWGISRERAFHSQLLNTPTLRHLYSSAKQYFLETGGSDPKHYGERKELFLRWLEYDIGTTVKSGENK